MKHAILYFILISIAITSCDNNEIPDQQADKFLKHYGLGLDDEGVKVITTSDGYLILCSVENIGRGMDIGIIQTDKFGNSTTPMNTYGTAFNDYCYSIKPNSAGYIICGSVKTSARSDLDVYLLQISKKGDFIWNAIYDSPLDSEAFDVIVLENGNIVCTGYTQIAEGNKDILFMEVMPGGDSVIIMSSAGNIYDEIAYSIVDAGGIYLFAGSHIDRESESSDRTPSMFLLKWRGLGVRLPQVDILKGTNSVAHSIVADGNGEYFVACNEISDNADGSQVHIIKIDGNMNKLWSKTYGENTFNQANQLIYKNGTLHICGTSSETELGGDMFVATMNNEGQNQAYMYTGDGSTYSANGFDLTFDGGFIVTGKSVLSENSTIVLGKMDETGGL